MLVCLSVLLLATSCEKDRRTDGVKPVYSDEITFSEALPEGWKEMGETRSAVKESIYRSEDIQVGTTPDGDDILMYVTVEDGIESDGKLIPNPETRADDLPENEDMGLFAYWMRQEGDSAPDYDAGQSEEFIINNYVDVADNYSYSPVKYWPGEGYWLKFFAYRPYIDADNENWLSESHDENVPKLIFTVPEEAAEQIDLQAAETGMITGDYRKKVGLDLVHVLSKVKFKVGNMHDVNIDELSLKGLANVGVYDFRQWSTSGAGDFVQQFSEEKGNSFIASVNGQQIGESFYMLPQSFTSSDARLSMKIRFPLPEDADSAIVRTPYEISRPLKDFTASWEGNKTYSYVITTPEEISVEVNDVVEGNVKKDLEIRNTGLATVYIRVALVGAWVIYDPAFPGGYEIVDDWEADEEGTFVWGDAQNPENWRKGPDGFYYYMEKVPSNHTVEVPLFESYTLTANAPVPGAELKLNIIAQAMHHGDAAQAWPIQITRNYPAITE